jgi:signal transduction histidine kinase
MIEAIKKLSRNTLFRLSLLGAFLFVVSLAVALGYVYFATITAELNRVDRSIEAEISELQQIYDTGGLERVEAAKLNDVIEPLASFSDPKYQQVYNAGGLDAVSRAVFLRGASYEGLYILQTSRSITGNLGEQTVQTTEKEESLLPGLEGRSFTKLKFVYSDPRNENSEISDRRGRGIAGNLFQNEEPVAGIVVGRDVEAITRTGERVKTAIYTSSILALILGLISSWYVSRKFTKRVEAFNKLADDVRSGNLDRRAPRNYSEDEMDMLAEHLNAMLDHIDRLMKAMRYAGDSVAHDLRTPLTRLRTRLESAAIDLGDTPEADTLFAAAEDASELLGTFDSVLRIARLEAGERRELLTDVDPKPLLDDLAELYEPACEDADLTFKSDIAPGIMVLADRGLMSQAVSNLIENAIKYTPKGGNIYLRLAKNKSGRAEISITDDGLGIPEKDRERVKERFVRLDKSRTLPGSGLGLALVDAVADLHRAEFVMRDGLKREDGAPGLSAILIFPRRRNFKP